MLEIHLNMAEKKYKISIDLEKFKDLLAFGLYGANLEENNVRGLEELKNLRSLYLNGSVVHSSYYSSLITFRNLQHLGLRGVGIDDNLLSQILQNNNNLESLNLSGGPVAEVTSLKFLDAGGCHSMQRSALVVLAWDAPGIQTICLDGILERKLPLYKMSSTSILREANSPSKRKRRLPTEDHKLSCVKRMENGESTSRLAKEMGVAPSTLREWKKECIASGKLASTPPRQRNLKTPRKIREKLLPPSKTLKKQKKTSKLYSNRNLSPEDLKVDLDSPKKLQLMSIIGLNPSKSSEMSFSLPHPDLDEAVYNWFSKNRHQGLFISCARLKSEATSLNKQLSSSSNFQATEQWLSCWKARYGVRYLPETLEKVTTDKMGEKEFNIEVNRVLKEKNLKKCQIFNCCEISWGWKTLPTRSSTILDNSTDDHVTVMGFCNADFSLKLPLVIIRRPGNVQILENKNNLPLYSIEKNEPWMFSSVLGNWFRRDFVPAVTKYLEERQLPPKAVLIVDDVRFLPTNLWFGELRAVFLKKNSTCLMRPFYQKLEDIKGHCKSTLIHSLALYLDCDRGKGIKRHLMESITIVNLLNWIYTAWEKNKGEKSREVLESLRSIEGFKDFSGDELNDWFKDTDDEGVVEVLEGREAVEIVQTPDVMAYGEDEEVGDVEGGIIAPSDAVRYLDCVIEFFCHCRNLSETDLAALRLARETANNISI